MKVFHRQPLNQCYYSVQQLNLHQHPPCCKAVVHNWLHVTKYNLYHLHIRLFTWTLNKTICNRTTLLLFYVLHTQQEISHLHNTQCDNLHQLKLLFFVALLTCDKPKKSNWENFCPLLFPLFIKSFYNYRNTFNTINITNKQDIGHKIKILSS